MAALSSTAESSNQVKKSAVVLVNLGTPESPTPGAVRKFLGEFLSDKRVVEIPRLIWWFILNGFILTTRPKAVAKAYQSIWWNEGSPLRVITERQQQALKELLLNRHPDRSITVEYAMTYGEPSIAQQITRLQEQGIENIAILPLYPQYSATTTAAVYDQVAQLQQQQRNIADTRLCKYYFDRPDYIAALASSVREFRQKNGSAERLLMSFHGIPKRCIDLGDPYYAHCQQTANALAAELGLKDEEWGISFQSRLGKAEWLKPYTSDLVKAWGREKLSSLDVICPAFAADCLETLEEISDEIREEFQEAGGGQFAYIPCLNDSPAHIECLANITEELLSL